MELCALDEMENAVLLMKRTIKGKEKEEKKGILLHLLLHERFS